MNDRYLFKAKRADNGEWVQGYYYQIWENGYILWGMTNDVPNMIEVDVSTICQCTGLKDKNGELIFENDIIERLDIHDIKGPSIGIIEYDVENTSFLIHWTDIANYSPTFHWKNRIGVIGNIFDNPELLESEE
mgnify:FL=1